LYLVVKTSYKLEATIMLQPLVGLSALLRVVPAHAAVAVAYGNDTQGNQLDALVITNQEGREYFVESPTGSQPTLRLLFPVLNGRLEAAHDEDYLVWTFRLTQNEHPNRAHANSRLLCAKVARNL
jgi:hypothetical protein